MKLVMAGSSGFLGTAWRDHLAREGHQVVRLVRGDALSPNESRWDPSSGQVDRAVIEDADVVANLAGAPLAHWPWTESYRRTFVASRVDTTRTLAEAVAASERKPALVAQGGISGYGDRGDAVVTEDTPNDADTFMAEVTRLWEAATEPAVDAGARVVVMRSGVVLDKRGGPVKLLRPVFKAGLGGPVGSGDQYLATISLSDWLRAATYLATSDDARGVYNVSGPNATPHGDFARQLRRLLHRPSAVPIPGFVLDALAGTVSSELLNSTRIHPQRLLAEGFTFDHPTTASRLVAALD